MVPVRPAPDQFLFLLFFATIVPHARVTLAKPAGCLTSGRPVVEALAHPG